MTAAGSIVVVITFALVACRLGWRVLLRYRGQRHISDLVGRLPARPLDGSAR